MAISSLYASHIRRVNAYFTLTSVSLAPSEITRQTGITPDFSETSGDPRYSPRGRLQSYHREGSWGIEGLPRLKAEGDARKGINEHIQVLLDVLLPRREIVLALARRMKAEIDFGILWESTYLYAGTGPMFTPQNMAGMAALGAGLSFDIYQINEPDASGAG
jgi:hypothetical protein